MLRLWPEREVIGPAECPILFRWTLLEVAGRKLMLHRFPPNADDRDVHDHPWSFVTLVLAGGYDDLRPCATCRGTGYDPASEHPIGYPPGSFPPVGNPSDWHALKSAGKLDWRGAVAGDPCPAGCSNGLVLGERMRRGMLRRRDAEHVHRTRAGPRGCWTLVWSAPRSRAWGFIREGRWWPWREYATAFGDGMRCESDDAPAPGELVQKTNRIIGEALLRTLGDRAPASLREHLGVSPDEVVQKDPPVGISAHAWRQPGALAGMPDMGGPMREYCLRMCDAMEEGARRAGVPLSPAVVAWRAELEALGSDAERPEPASRRFMLVAWETRRSRRTRRSFARAAPGSLPDPEYSHVHLVRVEGRLTVEDHSLCGRAWRKDSEGELSTRVLVDAGTTWGDGVVELLHRGNVSGCVSCAVIAALEVEHMLVDADTATDTWRCSCGAAGAVSEAYAEQLGAAHREHVVTVCRRGLGVDAS